jgi:3-oxoacyl-[acyl-carrier protein] reductase
MITLDLKGKKALVCGASDGIGKSTAETLAKAGCNVVLFARNENKLKQVLQHLPVSVSGQKHDYLVADFNHPEDVLKIAGQYIEQNKVNFHILVNNSGGPPAGPITKAKIEDFRLAFERHLIVNQLLAGMLLEGMKKERYGRIINIISTSVKQPLPNLGVSNTIRGAVASWAKTWANEVAQFGITVNNVLPGATLTSRLKDIIATKAQATGKSVEEIESEMLNEIPAGRFAQPDEIAFAVAFLASPQAAYINGVNLPVDGGRTGCL